MTAVIYARYSSDRQTEQSIEGQIRECTEFANREKIEIVGEYIDRAISGKTANRPEFQRMISDSKSHAFDTIIVYKLDRFARNRYDSAVYKAKLRSNGVKVLSAKENITDSPEGIILEGLLEAMNEYYSAELSQKIKRGMRENVIKGKTTGGNVAMGYKIDSDKKLVIDEQGAALVRKIFSAYDSGKTYAEICAELNNSGYKTSRGKQFRSDTISRILSNERYTGNYTCAGESAQCPVIIEKDLFDRVQNKLADSKQKHRHTNTPHDYLLTGKTVCGVCGRNLHGRAGTAKKRYYYYVCPNNCTGWTPAEELEKTISSAIAKYITPETAKKIANTAYELYQREKQDSSELNAAIAELNDVTKKINNGVAAMINGVVSETLKNTVAELEHQKSQLESSIKCMKSETPDFQLEHFEYFAQKMVERASEDDFSAVLSVLVNRVIVYKDSITILVNLTNDAKTPPLEQVTTTIRESSHNVVYGGGEGN